MLSSQEDIKVSPFFKVRDDCEGDIRFHEFAGWRRWTKARMVNGDMKSRCHFTPSRSHPFRFKSWWYIATHSDWPVGYPVVNDAYMFNDMHLSYTSPHFLNILIQETFGVKTMGRIMGLCFVALQIFGCWAVRGKADFTTFTTTSWEKLWFLVSGNPSKQSRNSYILWWLISLQGN